MDTIAVKRKNFNSGICLLKLLACFGVVNSHFGAHGGEIMTLPVPVFMFISIFMAYPSMLNGGVEKLKGRVYRLMVPFAFWGIFYFIAYSVFTRTFDLRLLLWQLTFGHAVCKPLFFLPLLLVFTSLAFAMAKFDKWLLPISVTMVVLSFVMQYSGVNYAVFGGLPDEMSWTLGRFFECLPPVATACVVAKYQSKASSWPSKYILCISVVTVAIYLAIADSSIIPSCKGFNKQGISLFLGTVIVCCAFIFSGKVLPSLKPESFLRRLADLSFGIYLLHVIVARFYELAFGKQDSYVESVSIFVISAIAVALMSKIFYLKEVVR